MQTRPTDRWHDLERWSPRLFVLAALFLLVGAANGALAGLLEGYSFDAWVAVVLELGRLAALLGTAGLTVGIVDRNARLGTLTRGVASLAVVAVSALIALATLTVAGLLAGPGVVGLIAYVLSVGAFLLVGAGIVRTGAYSRGVGVLLLGNVVALLVVFFGRLVVPLMLVATVVPAIQVLLYLGVGYSLRGRTVTTPQTAPTTDTPT